jgi:hypothetical protein
MVANRGQRRAFSFPLRLQKKTTAFNFAHIFPFCLFLIDIYFLYFGFSLHKITNVFIFSFNQINL